MPAEANKDFHLRRARAELDLAYRAPGHAAAAAHFKLSALHMARLRELETRPANPAHH